MGVQVITGKDVPASHLPFSPAIRAGDLVFVSGQASVDETGRIVNDDFAGEFRRSFENARLVLAGAGLGLEHVIQTRNYLGDQADLPEFNRLYADLFTEPYPARTTLMGCLGTLLRFEVDLVAYAGTQGGLIMRVGIVALLQESNTFIAQATTLSHFTEHLLVTGPAVREAMAGAHHEVGGFFEGLDRAGVEAVPLLAARALPFGVIEAGAFDALMARMFDQLAQAGPLDGVLAAAHGATVSAAHPDADGWWLTRLRAAVGPRTPIIATLDPHANVSAAMVDATDALIAYRTNPHIDQRARGVEAAELIVRTMRGRVRPTQALAAPPMAISIDRQCTDEPPCADVCAELDRMRQLYGVLSASLLLGFPYADVAEMGSGAIVVTDNDPTAAAQLAYGLGRFMWDRRTQFDARLIDVESALDRAASLDGPTCLLDMGDNIGGGSPADGTVLAAALHRLRIGPSFVCLYDPAAVEAADRAGPGARIDLSVGGHSDRMHGDPLSATFTVRSLHAGRFGESQPRHGGLVDFDMGRTAVLETDTALTVMVTSRRIAPWSLTQLTSCGLDPASFRVLVAKGVNAPIAAYGQVCPHLIRVDTPGVTTADLRRLPYHHRRRPMHPFEADAEYA